MPMRTPGFLALEDVRYPVPMLKDLILGNYKTVMDRMGLGLDDGRIHGVVEGIPIQMWFGAHSTHVGALLPRPAPFELSIVTTSLIGKLADRFREHPGSIGDPEFDAVFSLKATDVIRVAKLLDANARMALLAAAKDGFHPAVDPHSVHLRRFSNGGLVDSEVTIERDFHEAARLARILGASFGTESAL
jgi:hypothetical protein